MNMTAILAALAATAALAGPAKAEMIAALTGDDMIAIVDSDAKKLVKNWRISGASGKLVGVDVRPADGMLYGLTSDGVIWTIDATGKAMQKSKLDAPLPANVTFAVDFNPVADRMRVIATDGTNLRINVDDGKVATDGKLKFADSDMHKGETPKIVAGAYSNSLKGAKETALYDIDATIGALVKQAPPNDGVLNAIGKLGVTAASYAFDIVSDGNGGNAGWLMADANLYKVDLATGKATLAAKIDGLSGAVRDIAILPKIAP
ncbi:DUF4394 domain-containing protein [Terrarubrum flagellatum]|uniref:DUF4394 domain-containing protein n=1 Tax=Terrirubrum flagellatum TaxID=2895980 RepID=UPI003144F9D9